MSLRRNPALGLALAMIGYIALWFLIPRATFLPKIAQALMPESTAHLGVGDIAQLVCALLLMALPTIIFLAVQIALVYFVSAFDIRLGRCVFGLIMSLAILVGTIALMIHFSGIPAKLHRYPNIREILYIAANYYGPLKMPYVIAMIFTATGIGYLVSLRIKDKNLLLPVVMFAAYIDFWTVTRGPVSVMMKKAPEVATAVSAPIPQAGAGAFMPLVSVGPGDFLFLALVFACIHRFKMNGRRNYWLIFGSMMIGMLVVMSGLMDALPALVMLAVGTVAANWGKFKLSREEAVSTLVVGALLAASLPVVRHLLK